LRTAIERRESMRSPTPRASRSTRHAGISVGARCPYDRKGKAWSMPSCVLKPSASAYCKPPR
jgi:hypothetical protein